ncbi:TPA: RHS repeat-associated core domain-containing protein [Pseudomonas putida]|nr:RHS repeat-associated core domain-containing protein [Pseudomonas putida]
MQPSLTLLVKHQYDALNRLVASSTPSTQAFSQRFYMKDRLSTEIQGSEQRSIMQHGDQLLAQQQRQNGTVETRLIATDPQRSVLNVLDATRPHPLAYTPYGHRPLGNGLLSLLGFNGERPDPVTGWYLLGNGYRPFNPVLMCFTSPDSWSPFGAGGLNAYAYCARDPVNRRDDTGHAWKFWTQLLSQFNRASRNGSKSTSVSMTRLIGSNETVVADVAPDVAKLNKKKAIDAIKNPIARNEAKLSKVKSELTRLKTNPDAVVQETVQQYSAALDLMDAPTYEAIVRNKIPNRIKELKVKELHYLSKIQNLKAQAALIRQQKANKIR